MKYYIKVTCAFKWARKLPRKTETYESAKCVPGNTRKCTHNGLVSNLLKWARMCKFHATGPWPRLRLDCSELEGSLSCGGFVYTWKYVIVGSSAWYALWCYNQGQNGCFYYWTISYIYYFIPFKRRKSPPPPNPRIDVVCSKRKTCASTTQHGFWGEGVGVHKGGWLVCPLSKKGPFYRSVSTLLSLIVALDIFRK